MKDKLTVEEQQVVRARMARIHEQGLGIAFGLVLALGLFIATNVLVFRGGPVVGPNLGLLRWFFPGYSVTVLGSFVGAVYAFVLGYGLARCVATIYNTLLRRVR